MQNPQDTSVLRLISIRIPKKSPFFVSGVDNIKPLKELLDKIADNNYKIKVLANNKAKIQPSSSKKYLPIIEVLKREFYTYQRKQDKHFKMVLIKIYPSANISELRERRSRSRSLSSFAVVKNATTIICLTGSVGQTSLANFRAFHDRTFGSVICKYLAEDWRTTSSREVLMCCARCAVHCFTRFNKYL